MTLFVSVPKPLFEQVLECLHAHWFDGEYNNEDLIEVTVELEKLIEEY